MVTSPVNVQVSFGQKGSRTAGSGQSLSRSMRLGVTQQYIPTLEKFRAFWTLEDHIVMHAAFMTLQVSLGGESLVTDSALEIYRKVMIQIITEFTETHIGDY